MATESSTVSLAGADPRGRYLKTQDGAVPKREKRIPEYLEADEVNLIKRLQGFQPKTLQQRGKLLI